MEEDLSESAPPEAESKESKLAEETKTEEESVKVEVDVQPMEAEDASKSSKPGVVEEQMVGGEKEKESKVLSFKSSPTVTTTPVSQPSNKKPKVDLQNLATRQYLDQTVVPILLQGLSSLAKTRPEDPIKYLANYLLEHKQDYETGQDGAINGV